jgi:chemotaxis protein MotB
MKSTKKIAVLFLCSVVLLATSCVSKKTYNTEVQTVNDYAALDQQLSAALSADQAQLDSDQIQITQLQNQLKVTLVNSVVFSEGGYEVNAAGKATLDKIAPALAALKGQQIIVQGFTDNEPIGPVLAEKYPTNLDLSTARADNVVQYLISKGVPSSIISAQGFGDERPVAPNDNAADRAKNRRVEIVVEAASQQ